MLTLFHCNDFVGCPTSLYYSSSAAISFLQGGPGDEWYNTFSPATNTKIIQDAGLGGVGSTWFHEGLASDASNIYRIVPSDVDVALYDDQESGTLDCNTLAPPSEAVTASALRQMLQDTSRFILYANQNKYRVKKVAYWMLANDTMLMHQSTSDDSLLQAFYNGYSNSNFDKFYDVWKESKYGSVDEAAYLNNLISCSNLADSNSKAVNAIYFDVLGNDTLTLDSSQSSQLNIIAYEHPLFGGEAVFAARSMLGIFVADSVFTCYKTSTPGSISGPANGQCGASGVSYTVAPVTGATSYKWTVSDTSKASISGPINLSGVTVNFSSSFASVNLSVVANNICGASDSSTLVVYGVPNTPAVISGNAAVCAYSVESYSIAWVSGASSINWTVPAGATLLNPNGSTSAIVLWGSAGGNLEVNASNACDTSAMQTLVVNVVCRQAGNFLNDRFSSIEVFPNPTTGLLTIRFNSNTDGNCILDVKDLVGKSQFREERSVHKGEISLNLSLANLAKGVYFLNVYIDSQSKIFKIIVQ